MNKDGPDDTRRYDYRVLTEELAVNAIKNGGLAFLDLLEKFVQPGREQSLAKTKIEEAVMWAVKSITA